jgi:hypothetical protein
MFKYNATISVAPQRRHLFKAGMRLINKCNRRVGSFRNIVLNHWAIFLYLQEGFHNVDAISFQVGVWWVEHLRTMLTMHNKEGILQNPLVKNHWSRNLLSWTIGPVTSCQQLLVQNPLVKNHWSRNLLSWTIGPVTSCQELLVQNPLVENHWSRNLYWSRKVNTHHYRYLTKSKFKFVTPFSPDPKDKVGP